MTLKEKAYKYLTKNINDWEMDKFRAHHKPSGITWWIANGIPFFRTESEKDVSLGFFYSIKLYYWIKNAKRIKIINNI
jgi:hypothetical protein